MVSIAHEKAQELDRAGVAGLREEIDLTAQLRPVTMDDFWEARKKVNNKTRFTKCQNKRQARFTRTCLSYVSFLSGVV